MLEPDLKIFGEKLYALYVKDPTKLDATQASSAVLQIIKDLTPTKVSNKATGKNLEASFRQIQDSSLEAASAAMKELHQNQGIGSISITLVGETHKNEEDTNRGEALVDQIFDKTLVPTYVIVERDLKYQTPYDKGLLESQLYSVYLGKDFSTAFSIKQRSMVIAAYLLLCLAAGDQNTIDKVVLFFGEEHQDIFTYFENYCQSFDWICKRPRTYLLIPSHV